jgi:hypothetical protein
VPIFHIHGLSKKETRTLSSTSEGLVNIDQIGYFSAGISKGSCVVTGTTTIEVYPNPSKTSFHVNVSKPADM